MINFKRRKWLKELAKCHTIDKKEFILWSKQFDYVSDLWQQCIRGDWMLEILSCSLDGFVGENSSIFHNTQQLSVSCSCAKHLLKYLPISKDLSKVINDCFAWSKKENESKDVSILIADEFYYSAQSNLVALAYTGKSGNLYLACQEIAYIVSPPLDFLHRDNMKSQLLHECSNNL